MKLLLDTHVLLWAATSPDLPWHHRDPFDRLLVAQALEQGLTIVSHDAVFAAYGVAVLPA